MRNVQIPLQCTIPTCAPPALTQVRSSVPAADARTLNAFTTPEATSLTHDPAFFIVPVDKAKVAAAVRPYKLLPVPVNDESLYPNGFPADKHPVLTQIGFQNDIRMSLLQLMDPLLGASIQVPYVDRLNDGKTPFLFSVKQYIGGVDGKDITSVVPCRPRTHFSATRTVIVTF